MNVRKYIKEQVKKGNNFDNIKNYFVKQGYDKNIIEAEIDNYKRNKIIMFLMVFMNKLI